MKTLELTDEEAEVLKLLLERASEEFANHGCNDFNVMEELKLPREGASALAHRLREAMVTLKVAGPEILEAKGPYLMDWMLFSLFIEKLTRVEDKPWEFRGTLNMRATREP